MEDLGEEIIVYICRFLTPIQLCTICSVSKDFKRLAEDDMLWNQIIRTLELKGMPFDPTKEPTPKLVYKKWHQLRLSMKLFPLFGVVLGKTTKQEMARFIGCVAGKHDGSRGSLYYILEGQNFWHHGENEVHHMYLARGNLIPEKWTALGITWECSFNEYKNLCQSLFGNFEISEAPGYHLWLDEQCFQARLLTISTEYGLGVKYRVEFKFSYTPGDADTHGTLYSITITSHTIPTYKYDPYKQKPKPSCELYPEGKLFPLFGVVLGRTPVEEIANMPGSVPGKGQKEDRQYFILRSINFWCHDQDVVHHIHIVRGNPIPDKWQKLGITYDRTFTQFKKVLQDAFGNCETIETPRQTKFQENDCFSAALKSSHSEHGVEYTLEFKFAYVQGDENTTNTLYSITVHSKILTSITKTKTSKTGKVSLQSVHSVSRKRCSIQ